MRRALTPAGGTRAWRRLVVAVLDRDGYVCQMDRDGHRCSAPATTANQIVAREMGGLDVMDNLEAACVPCNLRAGAKLRGAAGDQLVAVHNGIIAAVQLLDRFGAPCDTGRREAARLLQAHTGHPWRSTILDHACRYRRRRGPLTRV